MRFLAALLLAAPFSTAGDTLSFFDGPTRFEAQPLSTMANGRLRVELRTPGVAPIPAEISEDAILQFQRPPTPEDFTRLGVRVQERLLDSAHMYRVRSARAGEHGLAVAARLQGEPALAEAVPDLYLRVARRDFPIPPDDPHYGGQWYLERIDIEAGWALSTGRPEVTIAVLDNGCDLAHPDIPYSTTRPAYDTVDDDDDPSYVPNADGNNHGTSCAGVVGATGNNGIGIAGACPQCTIQCIRLLPGPNQLLPASATVRAFDRVREGGAAVASNSWGYVDSPVPTVVKTAIEALQRDGYEGRGALVVFAAGNDRMEIPPDDVAAIDGVLTVSATNLFDELTSFSSFGPSVDLAAPGGTVTTDISGPDGDDPGDYTSGFGGTSSACPLVAGVAGLLFSADPTVSGADVHDLLIATARPAPYAAPDENGHDPDYGYGIVDPGPALQALLGVEGADAGVSMDAGVSADAGVTPDAGDGGMLEEGGCHSVPGSTFGTGLLALGLLARPWRPRRRRRTVRA